MITVIEVFNQLTQSELADCNTFKNIIENHYVKFRMIYDHIIRDLNMDDIYKISCVESIDGLIICIEPKRSDILIDFVQDVDDDYNFDVKFIFENGKLILQVYDTETSEVDIYESKFGIHKKNHSYK